MELSGDGEVEGGVVEDITTYCGDEPTVEGKTYTFSCSGFPVGETPIKFKATSKEGAPPWLRLA